MTMKRAIGLLKNVMWVGRATTFLVGLAVILALMFGVATASLAGTGAGETFNLGTKNTANAISRLVGSVAAPSLTVDNNSSGPGAKALNPQTEEGKPPMKVNSSKKVAKLNTDKLDGQDSAAFFPGGNLPRGKTIRGVWGVDWKADAGLEVHEDSISFGYTLKSDPTAHLVALGSQAPPECPGNAETPEAAPGHLCVYEDAAGNSQGKDECSSFECPGAARYGFHVMANSPAAGPAYTRGTWAVTAP